MSIKGGGTDFTVPPPCFDYPKSPGYTGRGERAELQSIGRDLCETDKKQNNAGNYHQRSKEHNDPFMGRQCM